MTSCAINWRTDPVFISCVTHTGKSKSGGQFWYLVFWSHFFRAFSWVSPFPKHTGQAFTLNIIIENGRVVYFLPLLVTSLSCPPHWFKSVALKGTTIQMAARVFLCWSLLFSKLRKRSPSLTVCMAESLSGQGRSESCVLIGYPSWQNGPILPAQIARSGFPALFPRRNVSKVFFFSFGHIIWSFIAHAYSIMMPVCWPRLSFGL